VAGHKYVRTVHSIRVPAVNFQLLTKSAYFNTCSCQQTSFVDFQKSGTYEHTNSLKCYRRCVGLCFFEHIFEHMPIQCGYIYTQKFSYWVRTYDVQ